MRDGARGERESVIERGKNRELKRHKNLICPKRRA